MKYQTYMFGQESGIEDGIRSLDPWNEIHSTLRRPFCYQAPLLLNPVIAKSVWQNIYRNLKDFW